MVLKMLSNINLCNNKLLLKRLSSHLSTIQLMILELNIDLALTSASQLEQTLDMSQDLFKRQ